MSIQKIKTKSQCVGCRTRSGTSNIFGDITSKCSEVLIGHCSICNGNNSVIFSDNTIVAEGLGDLSKNLFKKGPNVSKKMTKIVLKKPGRALEIGANVGTAFASRNPKAALSSLPEVINFYLICNGFCLRKYF